MINNAEEKFLYDLMTKLYNLGIPIVFKGAMVLKVIQFAYGNPSGIERETHDLDGDWINDAPSMGYLTSILQKAVNDLGYPLRVEPYRAYGERKSAGFNFVRLDNNTIFTSMDLSIRSNNCIQLYSYVNGIRFYGQTIDKIIVDKIIVCSNKTVFRRVKDVIDLYILSYCWNGNKKELIKLCNSLGKTLGDFKDFQTRYADLEHAYNKYNNSATVLAFNQVYTRVYNFLAPFASDIVNCYWNGISWN